MTTSYVAIDVETTGLDPKNDRITEVGAVRFTPDGEELETFRSFVNPRRPIPRFIQELTGVTEENVRNAPEMEEIADEFLEFVADSPIVGQNIGFDIAFLRRGGAELRTTAFDTSRLARVLLPGQRQGGLGALAEVLGVEAPEAHRALNDARTAAGVFVALRRRAEALPPGHRLQVARFLSVEDPLLAQEIAGDGWQDIPETEKVLPLPKPAPDYPELERAEHPKPVDASALASLFDKGPEVIPGFQDRPVQREMASTVLEAFNHGGHWLVEAGTGVGKSLAYLAPAALHAIKNGTRVVVSTNTINLQEQVLSKDIPALRDLLLEAGAIDEPEDLRVALLKGRSNYLCLNRWTASYSAEVADPDFARLASQLLLWLPETETGDRAELNLGRDEWQTWMRFSAQEVDCLSKQNSHVRAKRCFLQRARSAAESAHIIVVNHALLLADIATGGSAIPPFSHLIVDEAHNLEDTATQQFGKSITARALHDSLDTLHRPSARNRRSGGVTAMLRANDDPALNENARELEDAVTRARERLVPLFGLLGRLPGEGNDDRTLLTSGRRASPDWAPVEEAWGSLDETLASVINAGVRAAKEVGAPGTEDAQGLAGEVESETRRLEELRQTLSALVSGGGAETITWANLERDETGSLHSAPLDVGPTLYEELFSDCDTVIATSATLEAGGTMQFTASRLGLPEADTLQLGSPFDYKTSTLLQAPDDLPDPADREYTAAVAEAVVALAKQSRGRALVLFTSHAAMRATADLVRDDLEDDGLNILVQGLDGSPAQLTNNLRRQPETVLFGTSSFWEGVDIRGDALKLLVIARLPFAVPSDPVHRARSEQYDNAFFDYSLPAAILRFKQGFGRLIRHQDDSGAVVILDSRIHRKKYGADFINSLPKCTTYRGPLTKVVENTGKWLNR